jgi:hypothetical protein
MAGVAWLAGESTTSALLLAKVISVAAHLVCAAFVYLIARRAAPDRALVALTAYAWNPLVVIYIGVDGHNDSVLLAFLLASLYLGLRRDWELSLPLMACAVLVKFVPLVLFPLLVWYGRDRPGALVAGGIASTLLAAAAFAPFWIGVDTFDGVLDQASRMTGSPAYLASLAAPDVLLRPVAAALFGVAYLAVLRSRLDLVTAAYAVLLSFLLVLSFWTKPWYFIWPLALASVIGGNAFLLTVPGAIGLLASNVIGSWAWLMDWFRWEERWGRQFIEVWLALATIGGWLLGPALLAFRRLRSRTRWFATNTYRREPGRQGPPKITA